MGKVRTETSSSCLDVVEVSKFPTIALAKLAEEQNA